MKKNHMLRTVLLSVVFALLAIVLMTPVASAHTAAPARGVATATSQVPDIPHVNIVTQHHRSVFSSSTIHCKGRSGQDTAGELYFRAGDVTEITLNLCLSGGFASSIWTSELYYNEWAPAEWTSGLYYHQYNGQGSADWCPRPQHLDPWTRCRSEAYCCAGSIH
jgi:hypothetical protein